MREIENPMVIDRLWADKEQDLKVIGECEGCHEDILEGQDIYVFNDGMVHQDQECCIQYIGSISIIKVAGE